MLRQHGSLFVALAVSLVLAPSPARAQRLGVVTTLTGTATLARASQSQPLRFRDNVFEQDKIATAEKSLVRVLLGGKAIVTMRELSELTITEGHRKSIVHLSSGKIGLAVARQRMQPGDEIEVRTPNAVAAVRGTVFVVELIRPAGGAVPFVTNLHVVKGIVDVTPINAAPGTPPNRVGTGQSIGVTGSIVGPVQPFSPTAMGAVFADLSPREAEHPRGAEAVARLVSGPEGLKARALALALSPDPTPQPVGARENLPGRETQGSGQPNTATDVFGMAQLAAAVKDTAGVGSGGGGSGAVTQPPLVPPIPTLNVRPSSQPPALYTFSGANRKFATSLYTVDSKSKATLGSRLLQASASTLDFGAAIADIQGSLTGTPTVALLELGTSTVTAAELVHVSGAKAKVTTDGSLLAASGSDLSADGAAFLAVDGRGSHFTSTAKTSLLTIEGGSLTLAPGTEGVVVEKSGKLNLASSLWTAESAPITTTGSLLRVSTGGRVTTGPSTDELIELSGGIHSMATGRGEAIIELSAKRTKKDADTGLKLATQRPLTSAGTLLDLDGATVTTHEVLRVDTALLEASLPILNMRRGAQLTAASAVLDLSAKSKVTSAGPITALEASRLTITNGAAFALSGGSALKITGDLISLGTGSFLTLLSGPLVSLSGGSVLKVSGALVVFTGTGGSVLSVFNSLCGGPCALIGGIPVAFTGGATTANVVIGGEPIRNAALGTIKLASPSTALIAVDGKNTKVAVVGK
jgi:FecR-like protein